MTHQNAWAGWDPRSEWPLSSRKVSNWMFVGFSITLSSRNHTSLSSSTQHARRKAQLRLSAAQGAPLRTRNAAPTSVRRFRT